MSVRAKRKKDYPCIRCNAHVKINDQAVQCALCELWVHKVCENMADETFRVLDIQNEETGQCFWSCKCCRSYALKFDKRMRDVEKRVQSLEVKVPTMETDLTTVKGDIATLKTTTVKLTKENAEKANVSQADVTAAVFEEMRERESRRCNLIIHNLAEPEEGVTDKNERIQHDKNSVQELCNAIEVEVNIIEGTRFAKRLGALEDDASSPRPLLVGFKSIDDCKAILDKSPDLSEKEKPWSDINIVSDLTKAQRKEEKKLRDDVTKKNSELSAEESGNWQWKVVGRRGERRIAKVAVYQEEGLDRNQKRAGNQRGRGRGRGYHRRGRSGGPPST